MQLAGSELDEYLVLLALRCKSSQKHFSAFIRHMYTFVASWCGVFTAATDICNWAEKNDRVNHQTLLAEKAYFLFVCFFSCFETSKGRRARMGLSSAPFRHKPRFEIWDPLCDGYYWNILTVPLIFILQNGAFRRVCVLIPCRIRRRILPWS